MTRSGPTTTVGSPFVTRKDYGTGQMVFDPESSSVLASALGGSHAALFSRHMIWLSFGSASTLSHQSQLRAGVACPVVAHPVSNTAYQ